MGGRVGFRAYPKHLGKPTGEGIGTCDASGFVRKVSDLVPDERQGTVAREFADATPGFGTKHPQDVVQLGPLNDPSPVTHGGLDTPRSKQDLQISDREILASIREGRPPRPGY